MKKAYDKIIVGAGLYGLYAALLASKHGEKVLVLERERAPFMRATYINQARVHMGYHYPRSYSTAVKSAHYFERFVRDFGFCIVDDFSQVYATSAHFSWSDAKRFKKFCKDAKIRCDEVSPDNYFKPKMCDGAFVTREYAYDAMLLRDYFVKELSCHTDVEIRYGAEITAVEKGGETYKIVQNGAVDEAPFILSATYASSNELLAMAKFPPFNIKYELCEIILCEVAKELKDTGITVMDGPFFSIMPFGKTGLHSLTAVTFTPHVTSYDKLPTFACQDCSNGFCSPQVLGNCNECPAKPKSAYPYMSSLARKYLLDKFSFSYKSSLFSMKPILKSSEIDDSRPTVIREFSKEPTFVSVLSGKINTVYDLDEVLYHE
ncbi:MAG: FAD-binding oxidoreductase [Oscillospiraceae bacterium]